MGLHKPVVGTPLRYALGVGVILCMAWGGSVPVYGQSADELIELYDARVDLARLTPETEQTRSGTATFLVDDPGTINVEILSNIADLATQIELPGGQIVDLLSVAALGGYYRDFEVGVAPDPSCSLIPSLCETGFHYRYSFPSQGPGNYIVQFTAPVGMGGEAEGAVITRFDTTSPLRTAIVPGLARVRLGSSVVLTTLVFDDVAPITNAVAAVRIKPPDPEQWTNPFPLVDSGNPTLDGDSAIGDGLYSSIYTPTVTGSHEVVCDVNGFTFLGNPFFRQVGTRFEVYVPPAEFIVPLVLNDQGVDDNANALFDRVTVSAQLNVNVLGEYGVTVILEAPSGATLVGDGRTILSAGSPRTMTASIPAESFVELGEWGVFTITTIQVVFYGPTGTETPVLADQIVDGTQSSSDYQLAQFDRPAIVLRENEITTPASDTDGNGTFDELQFIIPMDLLTEGTYDYSATLSAPCPAELSIDIDHITGFLARILHED